MDAISSSGSSILEVMAMLQQLYHQDTASSSSTASSASSASTASTASSQNAAAAIGLSNSIAGGAFVSSAPLSGDSLMTLLQTQSFTDPSTTAVTGQVTNSAFAKWFSAADANHDQTISKSEFEAAAPAGITTAQADQLFASLDTGNTGSLSASQLQQGLAAAVQGAPVAPPPKGGTNRLFSELDTNGDGNLTLAEFEQDRASDVTLAEADATFAQLDPDGTGSITAQEFGQALVDGSTGTGSAQTASAAAASGQLGAWLNNDTSSEQDGTLSILSSLSSGTDTTNSTSLLDGDFADFLNTIQANQQSAASIQNSNSDLDSLLSSLGS